MEVYLIITPPPEILFLFVAFGGSGVFLQQEKGEGSCANELSGLYYRDFHWLR